MIPELKVTTLRNKFDFLKEQIQDNIDILIISETKIDVNLSTGQFMLSGNSTPFRIDCNFYGGCVVLHVW